MRFPKLKLPLRNALLYLLFGGLWIFLSDQILSRFIFHDVQQALYQTLKGWFFILVSAVFLYVLLLMDFKERNRVEEALKTESQRFQWLVDSNIVGIVVADASGKILVANEYYLKILGVTRGDLLEGQVDWRIFTPPEWLSADEKALQELRQHGVCEPYEKEYQRTDGTRVPVYIADAMLPGSEEQIIAFIIDISKQKKAENEIQARSRQLAALLGASQSLTETLNLAEVLQKITDQATAVLRIETTAIYLVEGERLYLGASTPALSPDYPEELRQAKVADHPHIAQTLVSKQPVTLPDVASASLTAAEQVPTDALGLRTIVYIPLIAKKDVVGVLILGAVGRPREISNEELDLARAFSNQAALAIVNAKLYENLAGHVKELQKQIMERKRVQAELRLLNLELEQRVQERTMELSYANRAKDEFLANMSHELRTPLNTVLGLSETLLEQWRGPLNEKQVESIELIASSGRHLLGLINDILEVSKIEAGKLQLHRGNVSLKELCESSLNFVRELALRKQISLELHRDESLSTVYADAQRIKQILINLLTNAVKFTADGGRVSLDVYTNPEQDQLLFSVTDTGIGITPEDLRKLFTPFTQLDSSLSRQHTGTGLGLALVQKLTELHGGSVHVESEPGKGSRFTIVLPWEQNMESQTPGESLAKLPETARGAKSPRERGVILLAEDNEINSRMMVEFLELQGFTVLTAWDGEEALEQAMRSSPDLILMDIQMPNMDGLEATRLLRADPQFASTPIIALTALAMPGDRERVLETGVNEYMSKPVNLKKLLDLIETLLRAKR